MNEKVITVMTILLCMFEINQNVRMIDKILDNNTDNCNAMYFTKCNKVVNYYYP